MSDPPPSLFIRFAAGSPSIKSPADGLFRLAATDSNSFIVPSIEKSGILIPVSSSRNFSADSSCTSGSDRPGNLRATTVLSSVTAAVAFPFAFA